MPPKRRAVLLFVAGAVSLALFSLPLWAPRFELKIEPGAITSELALAYTTPLEPEFPFPFRTPTDTMERRRQIWSSGKMGTCSVLRIRFIAISVRSEADDFRTGTTHSISQRATGPTLA